MSRPEFDLYANGYSAGMEHPLKRLLGGSRHSYLRPKLHWLNRELDRLATVSGCRPTALQVLEVGCADGALLRGLRCAGFGGGLEGCDVSEQMLACAARQTGSTASIVFRQSAETRLPYADGRFDAAILSAVVHHVPAEDRRGFLKECLRVVRCDGALLIIEHNPWNPVTRFVVATTRIDYHARLVSAYQLCEVLRKLGQQVDRPEHFMFFPPRLAAAEIIERWISWLPCGGQYAVTCHKSGSSVISNSGRPCRAVRVAPSL